MRILITVLSYLVKLLQFFQRFVFFHSDIAKVIFTSRSHYNSFLPLQMSLIAVMKYFTLLLLHYSNGTNRK